MTRYRVRHITSYQYGAVVNVAHSVAHLLPRSTPWQQVEQAFVITDPPTDSSNEYPDPFGNRTLFLAIEQPHTEMQIDSECIVVTERASIDNDGPAWEDLGALLAGETDEDAALARICSVSSPLVPALPECLVLARRAFAPGASAVAGLRALTHLIFSEFVFDPTFSDVSTPLADVIRERRGVCQDFAHLMIGALRSLGLPARYISGYIETLPLDGQPKLIGADASHAWCALYVPGLGWIDADPTNDHILPGHHVTVAWGRDYGDVAPVRGVVFGPPAPQSLMVSVDVSAID